MTTNTAANTTADEILTKLVAGAKCNGCAGTGKRGRGKCRGCEGKGLADLNHPRNQFNWGYHDAARDVYLGKPRQQVSYSADLGGPECAWFYAAGYEAGLAAQRDGLYCGDSSSAWIWLVGDLPARAEYQAAMRSWL